MPAKKIDAQQGPTAKWLLDQIEEFLTINEMENDGCTFGWLLCRDRTLVQRLRDGGDVTLTRMDGAVAFMRNPVSGYRTYAKHGQRTIKALRPLNIKPKEL